MQPLKQHTKQVSHGRIIVISLDFFTYTYPGQNKEVVDSPKGSVRQLRKRKQEHCYIDTQLHTNLSNHKQDLFVLMCTFLPPSKKKHMKTTTAAI